MNSDVDKLAKVIWDYHQLKQHPTRSDAIFALCSIDTRVAERAVELFKQGLGDYILFSGGVAHNDDLLKTGWDGPEAEHFADIAMQLGVPNGKVLVENKAQNTGQNITFTRQLLEEKNLYPKSFILVQKPYMERRTYATFRKQWPDADTVFSVTSPQISYESYFNEANSKDTVINIMVGDLQRIREYPKLGFQIEQDIPENVWAAYEQLVKLGFDKHLIVD